jgi:hypothetical protein
MESRELAHERCYIYPRNRRTGEYMDIRNGQIMQYVRERSEVLAENTEGKRPLGNLRADGRIMLKLSLK